jgi:hypothetical protein
MDAALESSELPIGKNSGVFRLHSVGRELSFPVGENSGHRAVGVSDHAQEEDPAPTLFAIPLPFSVFSVYWAWFERGGHRHPESLFPWKNHCFQVQAVLRYDLHH